MECQLIKTLSHFGLNPKTGLSVFGLKVGKKYNDFPQKGKQFNSYWVYNFYNNRPMFVGFVSTPLAVKTSLLLIESVFFARIPFVVSRLKVFTGLEKRDLSQIFFCFLLGFQLLAIR